jgi:hypothetical protein
MIDLRRVLRERPALTPRLALLAVLVVTAVVFVISCLVMAKHGGAHRAWEILTGVRSPVGQGSGLGIVLSVLGYAFVPIAIGLAATDALTRSIRKRTLPTKEAEDRILDKFDAALAIAHEGELEALKNAQAGSAGVQA